MADTPAQASLRAAFDSKLSVIPQTLNSGQQTQAQTNMGGPFLPLSGGTLTGALLLNADPSQPLGAATKQYVDAAISTGTSGAVLYTAQTLDASQQTQARANIAAGSAADVTSQGTRLTAVERKATENELAITALRHNIPTKTSQLTNDSGYVKATSGTTDLTAGTSPLATGELYFVYE